MKLTHVQRIERRKKIEEHRERLVNQIIEDLKNNIHDSHDHIFALCKEVLLTRTIKELKEYGL